MCKSCDAQAGQCLCILDMYLGNLICSSCNYKELISVLWILSMCKDQPITQKLNLGPAEPGYTLPLQNSGAPDHLASSEAN